MSRLPARRARILRAGKAHPRPAPRAALAAALVLYAAASAGAEPTVGFRDAWAGRAQATSRAPNVVSVFAAGAAPFHGLSGAVDVELAPSDRPVRVVAVEVSVSGVAAGGAGGARPTLEAWDLDGTFLGAARFRGPLPKGRFVTPFQTLVLDVRCQTPGCRPARIGTVRLAASPADPGAPPVYAIFDDLRFDPLPACSDDLDSDGDGLADYPDDPGCSGPGDLLERTAAVASDDGVDNDGDGRTDFDPATRADARSGSGDPDCASPTGASESPGLVAATAAPDAGLLARLAAGVSASVVALVAALVAVGRPMLRALR